MRPILFAVMLVVAAASACTRPAAAPGFSAADSTAIDSLYRTFRLAYASLDAARVVYLYREDALYGSGGAPGFSLGRGPIASNFEGFFRAVGADSSHLELRFRFIRRFRKNDLASDAGFYWLRSVRGDSAGPVSVGKFVTVMQRDSTGAWRFALDSYSKGSIAAFDSAPSYEP